MSVWHWIALQHGSCLQMKGEHWSGVGEIPGLDTTQIIYLDIVPIE
jgi:hypothetical protein